MKNKSIAASEAQEQKAIVKWLSLHPVLKYYFCKIDNESKRSVIAGYQAKLMGLRPGVSDLFIYYPTNLYHGLWLEVKRNIRYTKSAKENPSWSAQELFIKQVRMAGFYADFCFGLNHAIEIIEGYLKT